AARPFDCLDAMLQHSDAVSRSLGSADWLEAFAAHPRIGGSSAASSWSSDEQSGMNAAGAPVRERLAAGNRAYKARFGHIFIVCATGKSADEMLSLLEARIGNDPADELRIAAEEQRKISRLRLE